MTATARWIRTGAWAGTAALGAALAAGAPPATGPAAATQPATRPSPEQVMQELMGRRTANPLIEPEHRAPIDAVEALHAPLDATLRGVAPDETGARTRHEGELVMGRRGRLIYGPGGQAIFAFEGDSRETPEPPMVLQPCRELDEMEALARDRGDKIVFVVSGQVFAYRGANYLLPTMAHIAVDQGNIKH
jgi:hypothetical protein